MKYLPLVWRSLLRHKVRTFLVVMSIVVAFVLFGLLAAINKAFNAGIDLAGEERLVMRHKVSIIQPLPISYMARIRSTPGVDAVAQASWFGGIYQDPKNFFPRIAVDPETHLDLYPELRLPEDEKQAWFATRTGAVAGRDLADRFGWKIGDRIPIQGDIYRRPDGSAWEFDLVGIYDGATQDADLSQFFFRYDYLDEGMGGNLGLVGWYVIRVADPDRAPSIAEALDATFANSSAETKTATEAAFVKGFADQIGNTAAIIRAVLAAVFFTILLVVGNTMAQAVRERTNELGVLKALGFSDGKVLSLVLGESCFLAFLGGVVGLGLSALLVPALAKGLAKYLPVFYLPARDLLLGVFFVLALGLITGLLPALQARRLRVADALRRA
ncbi:MAG: ABC transporter permease [Acidobacteria bacterium]|nr:ABC transporter permease [Acidobacteriota bacterium]